MPEETTSNPEPENIAIPQALETVNSAPSETVVVPIPVIAPPESVPVPEPVPEVSTAQLGGSEPFAPASTTEIPTVTPDSVSVEAIASEVVQSAPVESLNPTATTPALAEVTAVPPVVAPALPQTLTKSIRELFAKAQSAIQFRKRKKLDRIMNLFVKQTKITNDEVEKLLHVSDATTTRYLSALEKEGKIKQSGKTGKGVSYQKI